MGSALTSKSAPRTSQRMRTRPARTRAQRDLKSSDISTIHSRRTWGLWCSASAVRRACATGTLVLEAEKSKNSRCPLADTAKQARLKAIPPLPINNQEKNQKKVKIDDW